jgi:hypothetical protein
MKVKIRHTWKDGQEGYILGDVLNLTEDRISFKGLNEFVSAPISDIIAIYPDEGLYTDPNPNLTRSQYWKNIGKKKIIKRKQKR